MSGAKSGSRVLRFSVFELDLDSAELFKQGRKVKLQGQPFELLRALLERPGQVVTREELRQRVWPSDTVVDFDRGLNRAINKVRGALGDSAGIPRLVETLPRRGYRFIGSIRDHESVQRPVELIPLQRVRGHHRLPVPRTPFIGREQELAAIQQLLLNPGIRLVTLTGSGGSGKTRLGLEAAGAMGDFFEGETFFVGLGSINDAAMVPAAIAQALDIRETGGQSFLEVVKGFLEERGSSPMLLLLDNLEHLLSAAPLVAELLELCRGLKVLVTSQAALRIYGEHEFPVLPLETPDATQFNSFEALKKNPAVALFAQRAAAVRPDFRLTAENASAVAEICSRVDGLPLAIELAAARVKMLPLNAILLRLESRLQLLTAGARDLPERHQTLRKTLDWSYDLLGQPEQKLFRRLGVFVGGCTLEAAEAVCNTDGDLGAEAFEGMSSLIDKSLIRQVDDGADEPRFRMLKVIREYALERLRESGEEDATRRNHAAYCLVVAEEGNPELDEGKRAEWLALCDIEHDNFRAALDWLFQHSDLGWSFRLCLALFRFWDMREHFTEARARMEGILRLSGKEFQGERAKTSHYLGAVVTALGDFPAAISYLEQSLSLYKRLGDRHGIAVSLNALAVSALEGGDYFSAKQGFEESLVYWREVDDRVAIARCLHNLANVAKARGEYSSARSALSDATQIFEELGDRNGAAWSVNQQGDVAREQGDLVEARALYERALAEFREADSSWGCARSLADLGLIACEQMDYSAAQARYRESLEIFTSLGHRRGIARILEGLACLALARGEAGRALSIAAGAAHLRKLIRGPLPPAEQSRLDKKLQPAWTSLGEQEGQRAWETGWAMSLERAVEYSLEDRDSVSSRG